MDEVVAFVSAAPGGASAAEIGRALGLSRATVNRRLREAVARNLVVVTGAGPNTLYFDADPLRAIHEYFERDPATRPFASFQEKLLGEEPSFHPSASLSISQFIPLGKRDLIRFLVDFSCASSALEGGTYTLLDTMALIQYGEKAAGRPLSDAVLVTNHRDAFEYLHDHPSLDVAQVMETHRLLTTDRGMEALRDAPHFLDKQHAGKTREYEDVNIALSTYAPPFRPGTGYIAKAFEKVLETAKKIVDPFQGAVYLLTRIPYLQPFMDGNKRLSRVLCNVPLLNAGLPPISFMDFNKRDYILSMLAFYELGNIKPISTCFERAYMQSCLRLNLVVGDGAAQPK